MSNTIQNNQEWPDLTPKEANLANKFARQWQNRTAGDFFEKNPRIAELLDLLVKGMGDNNEVDSNLAKEFYAEFSDALNKQGDGHQPKQDPHRLKKQFAQDLGVTLVAGAVGCLVPGVGIGIAASIASSYISYRLKKSEKEDKGPFEQAEDDLNDANERLDGAGGYVSRAAQAGLTVAGAVTGMSTITAAITAAIKVGEVAIDAVYDSKPDKAEKDNSWQRRMSARRSESINNEGR